MDVQLNDKIALAADELPVELRDVVTGWFEQLESAHSCSDIQADTIEPLVRLVACSQFAAKVVMRDWEWFTQNQESL